MQQVQKVNDYCTRRENCPKSRRRVGQYAKCNNTFARVACKIFSTIEQKTRKKQQQQDKQQLSPVRRV
jgi:hypothetical protein